MITVEVVAQRLLTCPKVIVNLEQAALESEETLQGRRNELKELEASLLMQENGPINGRNEEVRKAQLFNRTAPERILVEIAEKDAARARLQVVLEKNSYKSWLAVGALMTALRDGDLEVELDA